MQKRQPGTDPASSDDSLFGGLRPALDDRRGSLRGDFAPATANAAIAAEAQTRLGEAQRLRLTADQLIREISAAMQDKNDDAGLLAYRQRLIAERLAQEAEREAGRLAASSRKEAGKNPLAESAERVLEYLGAQHARLLSAEFNREQISAGSRSQPLDSSLAAARMLLAQSESMEQQARAQLNSVAPRL